MQYTLMGLFSGAGGLELGFEQAGFRHLESVENEPHCCRTLRYNRPSWTVREMDIHDYVPDPKAAVDVLVAGFPCQGFSLGGVRDANDPRNLLYLEAVRVAAALRPRIVVLENVLNLRTIFFQGHAESAAETIAEAMRALGYRVYYDILMASDFGAPQTRRRFIFVCFRDAPPTGYHLPMPSGGTATIRQFLFDLGQDDAIQLPNHSPSWGFKSAVHIETGLPFDLRESAVPIRLSRTGSDGNPVRSFDQPFPAIDTATVWGWGRGNVVAERLPKDRASGKHIRNPDATITLWRISASQLRAFTHREYARLQTFPDEWVFLGNNKRDVHKQIGNAVPVTLATAIGRNIYDALLAQDTQRPFMGDISGRPKQLALV
jgi:DNA (cytosine-5)-methyltransferase 1